MLWDGRSGRGVAGAALTIVQGLVRTQLFGGQPARPLYVVWYTTLRCNLACAFCDDSWGEKYPAIRYPELGTADARSLLRTIRRNCGSIYFTGGEPLVRKDFAELLANARELRFWPIFVNTNLDFPNLKRASLSHADVIIVSLGSTNETANDRIIGGRHGHTHRIVDNIRMCAREQAHSGPRVMVNCVICPGRVEDARSVFEFCQAERIWFSPVAVNRGPYVDANLLDDPAYRPLVHDILAAKQRGERIYGSHRGLRTLLGARPFRCYPTLTPHIYPNGDLLCPCHPLRHKAVNILEKGSLRAASQAAEESLTTCDNRCHLPCYVTNNGWMEHPLEMVLENFRVARSNGTGGETA